MLKTIHEAVIPGEVSLQHWLGRYLCLSGFSLLIMTADLGGHLGSICTFLAAFFFPGAYCILFPPKLKQEIDFCFQGSLCCCHRNILGYHNKAPSPVSLLVTKARGVLKGKRVDSSLLLCSDMAFPHWFTKMLKYTARLKESYNGHLMPRFYSDQFTVLALRHICPAPYLLLFFTFSALQRKR